MVVLLYNMISALIHKNLAKWSIITNRRDTEECFALKFETRDSKQETNPYLQMWDVRYAM
jgi:hypothetical protein